MSYINQIIKVASQFEYKLASAPAPTAPATTAVQPSTAPKTPSKYQVDPKLTGDARLQALMKARVQRARDEQAAAATTAKTTATQPPSKPNPQQYAADQAALAQGQVRPGDAYVSMNPNTRKPTTTYSAVRVRPGRAAPQAFETRPSAPAARPATSAAKPGAPAAKPGAPAAKPAAPKQQYCINPDCKHIPNDPLCAGSDW